MEISNRRYGWKILKYLELNILLNSRWVKKTSQDKFKNSFNEMKTKIQVIKICGIQQKQCLVGNIVLNTSDKLNEVDQLFGQTHTRGNR